MIRCQFLMLAFVTAVAVGCGDSESEQDAGGQTESREKPSSPANPPKVPLAELESRFGNETLDDLDEQRAKFEPREVLDLPTDPKNPTWESFEEQFRKYERPIIDDYEKRSGDRGEARTSAIAFLKLFVELERIGKSREQFSQLRQLGQRAIDQESDDPVVLACHGLTVWGIGDDQEANHILTDAAKRLTRPQYSPELPMKVHNALYRIALKKYKQRITAVLNYDDGNKLRDASFTAMLDAIEHESEDPLRQRWAWFEIQFVFEKLQPDDDEVFYRACLKSEKIHPWLLHMIAGGYYQSLAWHHRGDGYSNTVTEEGWNKFHEYLPKAGYHFVKAWLTNPEHPHAPARMITISMAGGDHLWSSVVWFNVAVRTQLDFYSAYDKLLYSLRPRWGGSIDAIINFGGVCLATGRFDTTVPDFLIDCLLMAQDELRGDHTIWHDPRVTKLLKILFSGFNAHEQAQGTKDERRRKFIKSYEAAVLVAYGQTRGCVLRRASIVFETNEPVLAGRVGGTHIR